MVWPHKTRLSDSLQERNLTGAFLQDGIVFQLQDMPATFTIEDRSCRNCQQSTAYVLTALDKHYSFPCCYKTDCIGKVAIKIKKSIHNQ